MSSESKPTTFAINGRLWGTRADDWANIQEGMCRPVYETLPGWKSDTSAVPRFEALPAAARNYVKRLESVLECEIGIISTSPLRERTIIRPASRIARWLPER